MRAVRARLRLTDLRAERGGVLVEIMVSAVVMVLVAGATFKSIDQASSVSADSKTKSVATSVAQKYLDELRSKDPQKLSSFGTQSGSETIDGVTYSFTRSAYWVRDSTQDKSCDGNPGDYLKLGITVTWNGMNANDRPVKQYSILTEPNGTYEDYGNLAIVVKDDAGVGQSGIPITLSPGGLSDTTDANGCAYFATLNPGAYTGTIQKSGYVDKNGNTSIAGSWTIVKGQTTLAPYGYAPAATPTVNFILGSTSAATTGQYVTFTNNGRTLPLVVGNGTDVNSLTGSNLYPFTSPYVVYSGKSSCTGNNTVNTSVVLPTATAINVKEPPVVVQIKRDNNTITDGNTKGLFRIQQSGCVDKTITPQADGTIADANNGFPAASYSVCAQYKDSGGTTRALTQTVNTTSLPAGNVLKVFNIVTTGTNPPKTPAGPC
jgi:hypothetical protein